LAAYALWTIADQQQPLLDNFIETWKSTWRSASTNSGEHALPSNADGLLDAHRTNIPILLRHLGDAATPVLLQELGSAKDAEWTDAVIRVLANIALECEQTTRRLNDLLSNCEESLQVEVRKILACCNSLKTADIKTRFRRYSIPTRITSLDSMGN